MDDEEEKGEVIFLYTCPMLKAGKRASIIASSVIIG